MSTTERSAAKFLAMTDSIPMAWAVSSVVSVATMQSQCEIVSKAISNLENGGLNEFDCLAQLDRETRELVRFLFSVPDVDAERSRDYWIAKAQALLAKHDYV